jgi:hypothetical protein
MGKGETGRKKRINILQTIVASICFLHVSERLVVVLYAALTVTLSLDSYEAAPKTETDY